ncbi:MAG: isopenicillin N synthase family dioxygenase [Sphingobium sp.]
MSKDCTVIPVLSLKRGELDFAGFAKALGHSFRRFGFAIIRDHRIDESVLREAWTLTAALFALPDAVKDAYRLPGGVGQRGYTPFRSETAKGAIHSDLKEFWHVGREPGDGGTMPRDMPLNIWPNELPGFRGCFTRLYAEFERIGATLLSAIARDLGLSPTWFEGPTHEGNSILRLLHYPPLAPGVGSDGAVRAGAHEDINLITLLLGAEEAGLQLRDRSGNWLDIDPPEGALVVNIGDMLQRLTNHVLPSTTHRVINPSSERRGMSRYSMPFFLHLRPDFIIDPLPQCISDADPRRCEAISANDYLRERLREIGLLTG